MTDPISASRPGLRRALLAAAFAATFVAGGLAFSGPSAIAMQMAADHAGMGAHAGMHARVHAHIERMLAEVDATPEQRTKIEGALKTAFHELGPVHQTMADTHSELHRLLTAPTIDRAALEQLRAQRVADFDRVSRRAVEALANAAEVLTPEQRARLATLHAQHAAHARPQG